MEWRLLSGLPDEHRRELLSGARRRRFARGEIIFHEGDPGDTVHLVAKGRIAMRVSTPLGDVATLLVLSVGDYFGELAVLSPAPRNSTVVALEAVETLTIDHEAFDRLRRAHPAVNDVLLLELVAEVRRLSSRLIEAMYLPVDKRAWRRLLDLSAVYGPSVPVVIPLTQEDIAQLVGTTRPTLNKLLRQGEADHVLRIARGRIELLDRQRLERLAR